MSAFVCVCVFSAVMLFNSKLFGGSISQKLGAKIMQVWIPLFYTTVIIVTLSSGSATQTYNYPLINQKHNKHSQNSGQYFTKQMLLKTGYLLTYLIVLGTNNLRFLVRILVTMPLLRNYLKKTNQIQKLLFIRLDWRAFPSRCLTFTWGGFHLGQPRSITPAVVHQSLL